MKHNFREHLINPDGELMGFKTVVQEHKCRVCGVVIELPMGASPTDYQYNDCEPPKPAAKTKWSHPIKGGRQCNF